MSLAQEIIVRPAVECDAPVLVANDIAPKEQEVLAKRHLTIEIFSSFLDISEDENREIDEKIIVKLLESLDSKDEGERAFSQLLLHRFYFKYEGLRPYMRKQINNVFYRFIHETEEIEGIAELLELLKEIIKDYDVLPLADHEQFLFKILLPLHKSESLKNFYIQLGSCIMDLLKENPTSIPKFINGLLKLWPKISTKKEVMFMREIVKILQITKQKHFLKILMPLFHRVAKCVSSPCFNVAEAALYLWSKKEILALIIKNNEDIMTIMLPSLCHISREHWNEHIRDLVYSVLKIFMQINEALFKQLSATYNYKFEHQVDKLIKEERKERWIQVKEIQSKRSKSLSIAKKPSSLSSKSTD